MSILGNIFGKIFRHDQPAQEAQAPTPSFGTPSTVPPASAETSSTAASPPPAASADPGKEVDVEAILNDMAKRNPQNLNWRTSIVDLMKLLDLDSSLTARKQLAQELNYNGDMNDSASMNIWLHKQVMKKLAENGGKVPADLKD